MEGAQSGLVCIALPPQSRYSTKNDSASFPTFTCKDTCRVHRPLDTGLPTIMGPLETHYLLSPGLLNCHPVVMMRNHYWIQGSELEFEKSVACFLNLNNSTASEGSPCLSQPNQKQENPAKHGRVKLMFTFRGHRSRLPLQRKAELLDSALTQSKGKFKPPPSGIKGLSNAARPSRGAPVH